MNLRFVSWNIHGRTQIAPMLALLQEIAGDIIALQEVTDWGYQQIVESSLFSWSVCSLDIRPPQAGEGRARQLGCAILGNEPFRLRRSYTLEHAPLPERTLIVEIEAPTKPLKLCSFHAPPGVSWDEIKPQSMLALAHWLAQHTTATIVGMDANAPKTDHPIHELNEWWWDEEDEEPALLGPRPLHTLKDTLRTWLANNPVEYERLRKRKPRGPLAVSYKRGYGAKTPCRYDFIYATTDFQVSQIRYLYEEAIEAGSDHAMVVADLVMPACTIPPKT